MSCPLGCVDTNKRVVIVERRMLGEHRNICTMRVIACEYCGNGQKACEMEVHFDRCTDYPVPCPNNCGKKVPRNSVDAHLSVDCPLQVVKCPFREYGCEKMMERKLVDLHEREYLQSHFKLTCISTKKAHAEQTVKIQKLETENKQKDLKLKQLRPLISSLKPFKEFVWKISEMNSVIYLRKEVYSDPFYVGYYKCLGFINWMVIDGTYFMGCYLSILKGEWDDNLKWPFLYNLKITLVSQVPGVSAYTCSIQVEDAHFQKTPNCFKKPTGIMGDWYGFREFRTLEDMQNAPFNVNNSITLVFVVQKCTF